MSSLMPVHLWYHHAATVGVKSAVCLPLLVPLLEFKFCVSAYTHVDGDGNVVRGKLVHFPCEAEIVIFSPLDSNDHRLFVIVKGFHTHYLPSQTKSSMMGKLAYRDAAETFAKNSVASITVGRLERGKHPSCHNCFVFLRQV
jgi:hypothetical protein